MPKLLEKSRIAPVEHGPVDTIGPAFVTAVVGTVGFGSLWGMYAVHQQHAQMWPVVMMGLISALVIRWLAVGGVRRSHQLVAVLAVLIGFLVVRYILFFGNLKMFFQQEYSHKMSVELAAVSAGAFISFIDSAKDQFQLSDLIWLSFAVLVILFVSRHSFQWLFRIHWPRIVKTIPQKS